MLLDLVFDYLCFLLMHSCLNAPQKYQILHTFLPSHFLDMNIVPFHNLIF